MELSEDEETTKRTSVYVRAERYQILNKAAIRVNYETDSPKQKTPSYLAQYLIDNYLEAAVQKLIEDSKQ